MDTGRWNMGSGFAAFAAPRNDDRNYGRIT